MGNVRWGFGVQVWPDGAKYEGLWENGKANGAGTDHFIQGNSRMWMEMYTKATGKMTKLQEEVYTNISTGPNMKASGLTTTSTE